MNARLQAVQRRAAPGRPAVDGDLPPLLAVLAALLLLYLPTAASMARVWLRSQTFAHGLVIVPISAWLIWTRRASLLRLPRQPAAPALAVLAGLGAGWLLATIANVPTLQQYLLVAMLPACIAALFGVAVLRALAFPLCYLALAVPFGEVFIPPLIDFTAWFTVHALQLSGIPVFREDNYLTLPSGNWAVVEACSGLRYVIASLALGTLYAYLSYRSLRRRLVFMAVAIALPVLANGMRAYLIVMLGHLSDLRLAAGVDHLVYGWLFFGLVSLLLFWLGSFWRDQPLPPGARPVPPAPAARTRGVITAAGACMLLLACWPMAALLILRQPAALPPPPELIVATPPPWQAAPLTPADWQAPHAGRPLRFARRYSDGQISVTLQLSWYQRQVRGAELLTPVERQVRPGQPQWRELSDSARTLALAGRRLAVRQSVLSSPGNKTLVWRWYRQNGRDTGSPQMVKLLLAGSKLLGKADSGAEIVLACAFEEQPAAAEAAMRRLLPELLPAIDAGLRHVEQR